MALTRRHTAALGALAGLALGWNLRPVPVSESTSERAEAREVEVFTGRDEWVTRRELATDTHQVREETHGPVITTWPDGRREERGPVQVREETGVSNRQHDEAAGVRVVEVEKRVEVEVFRDVERIVPTHPDWLLSAQVGAGSVGLMYGGQVSRRVLGPLWLQAGVMAGGGEWVAVGGVGIGW